MSWYRLWVRIRRSQLVTWKKCNPRPYIVFGLHAGCISPAFRQAAAAEGSVRQGGSFISVLWDLQEYYEHLDRGDLLSRCTRLGMPGPCSDVRCMFMGIAGCSVGKIWLSPESTLEKEAWQMVVLIAPTSRRLSWNILVGFYKGGCATLRVGVALELTSMLMT